MSEIDNWRMKIDEINIKLVKLLNERVSCAIEIGKIKKQNKLPIHDPSRESHILEKITSVNDGPISNRSLQTIFKTIVEENRKAEEDANS